MSGNESGQGRSGIERERGAGMGSIGLERAGTDKIGWIYTFCTSFHTAQSDSILLEQIEPDLELVSGLSKSRPTPLDPIENTAKIELRTSQIENAHTAHSRSGSLRLARRVFHWVDEYS